jgi:DNA-directed RNA polymerase III subunit RPC1
VPVEVAKILTFPEVVNSHNIEMMRKLVINGEYIHPGANFVIEKSGGKKTSLK